MVRPAGTRKKVENGTARSYRERAEELRMVAEGFKDEKNRLTLQKLAFDYECMADTLDKIPEL